MVKLFEIIANTCMLSGAILISIWPLTASVPYTFITFLIGHIIWAILGIRERRMGIIWLNAPFVFLDIYAIIIRI